MGSQHPVAAVAPQHELPPPLTRKAACPYFSFTTSLISVLLMALLLFADLDDLFRLHGLVARAALGVQKLEQFLQRVGVCGVAEKSAFSSNMDEVFRLQLVEMMRQG